ncbi:MAG: hypothetical protein HY904_05240 [Deltaproteobacteria bacterium]|nr:hypothetical protein [Deltaproteobacteria bacterium]
MRTALLPSVCAALLGSGCFGPFSLIQVTANLEDKTQFNPNQTGFVVVDEFQEVTAADGTVTQRERAVPRIIVVLSRVRFDPEQDLAALPSDDRLNLVQELRRNDLVIFSDIPADRAKAGTVLQSNKPSGPADEFTFLLQRGNVGFRRNATYADVPPFADQQGVTLEFVTVNLREYGRLDLTPISLRFERGANQPAEAPASTGRVTIRATLPVINERLGESNLAVIREAVRD